MKRQSVLTHTIRHTKIPALLDSRVTNTPYCEIWCPQKKKCLLLCFIENITCLSVGLLRIRQVSSVSSKIVYNWVTTNCCCMTSVS
jgi:hypothetical protein